LNEAKGTGWVVNTNPFEGGSDHIPFLNARIPGLLMWHFTDVYYHTDADRLDMVSAEEMKHSGVSALLTAYLLATADTKTANSLIDGVVKNALTRLRAEFDLSKKAITEGKNKEEQRHIIEAWRDWYLQAISTAIDIPVTGDRGAIERQIADSKKNISKVTTVYLAALQ
jgi:aminopeptidase YwaD